MKNKIAILTLSLLGLYQPAQAITLIGWDIPTSAATPTGTTAVAGMSVATGVNTGNFTMGTGLTSAATTSTWRASAYNTTTTDAAALAAANTASDYWAFQFGASSGYSVTVNGIGSGTWSISNSGPTKMSMIYSTTSNFASYSTIATATVGAGLDFSFAPDFTTALGIAPITIAEGATGYFRLVGYGAPSTGGTGGLKSNLTAPDFSILGTTTSLTLLSWTGGAGVWANGVAANWQNPAGASTAWVAGRDATIANGGTLAVDAAGVTAGVMTVSGATASTFTGGAVSAGSLAMTAGSTLNLSNANSAVSGAIDLTDATLSGGNLAVGSAAVTVSTGTKTISTSLSGATATLTKSGAGELILSGDNTYGGQTAVAAGTLTTSKANILSDTATLQLAASTTFKLGGNETVGNINAASGSTNNLQSYTLTSGGNNLSASNSAFTTGTGGLVKNGTGQMYMISATSSNNYSGGFTLNNGELMYASSGTVTAGAIVGTPFGTGTLTWNGGTICSASDTNGKSIFNTVVLNGTVQSGKSSYSTTNVRLNSSTNALGVITGYNTMLNVATNAQGSTTLAGDSTINTLAWTMWEQNISGNYRLTKGGQGASSLSNNYLTLVGSNNIAGVTVNSGILAYRNRYALGTGTLILADGVTVGQDGSIKNSDLADGDANRTVANNISVLGNATFGLGGTTASIFSGNVNLNNANRTLTVASETTFSGSITNGGLVVQRGEADLTSTKIFALYGANTYDGGTTVIGVADRTNNVTLGLGNNSALGTGSLTFSGGGTNTMRAEKSSTSTETTRTIANNIAINSGVTLNVDAKNSLNVVLNGVISGGGALIKTNATTLTLGGANTYAGGTTVNGGTLMVDGSVGAVTVNISGSLGGSGTVGALTLQNGAFLTPGNSPGTLTATSAIILGGSTYNWQITSLTGTAGTNWDLFSVTKLLDMSDVTSSNRWNLVITPDSGFTGWTDTNEYGYVFAQAESVSGFSDVDETDITSLFNITTANIASLPNPFYNVNGDFKVVVGSAGDLTTLKLMAIPEPSTGSLLGFGLAGLVVTRLLRRKQS